MAAAKHPLISLIERFAGRLRFPTLFAITAVLFFVDLLVPDALPFADELLLALGALVLGSLRKRGEQRAEQRRDG